MTGNNQRPTKNSEQQDVRSTAVKFKIWICDVFVLSQNMRDTTVVAVASTVTMTNASTGSWRVTVSTTVETTRMNSQSEPPTVATRVSINSTWSDEEADCNFGLPDAPQPGTCTPLWRLVIINHYSGRNRTLNNGRCNKGIPCSRTAQILQPWCSYINDHPKIVPNYFRNSQVQHIGN